MTRAGAVLLGAIALAAGSGPRRIPDDPFFPYQLTFDSPGGLRTIPAFSFRPSPAEYATTAGLDHNLPSAWSITTGSKQVVVALLDDGFFYQHDDVKDNIWRNPGETGIDATGHRKETNGIDDDHNGYVDDVMGWDFAFDDPDPDAYVFDGMDSTRIQPYGHSIPALGIIGAKGNNGIGVAGINWDVSLMLLKIGAQGIRRGEVDRMRAERAAKAIRYAADNGARVINWSGFVEDPRPEPLAVLKQAIEYAGAKGVLLVVAAGNSMLDVDDPANCRAAPVCFDTANLLLTAEIGFDGELVRLEGRDRISGSNYGRKRVHVAAMGRNFTTAVRNGLSAYRIAGGTSNAAPVATGVAALVLSVRPQLRAPELKAVLIDSARKLPGLAAKVASGGMIDAYAAVKLAMARYPRLL